MSWKFWRRSDDSMDPQRLLAQAHAQQPLSSSTGEFRMTIEDVFAITGRGTVVTGRVASGVISKGQPVTVTRTSQQLVPTTVDAIEMFRKKCDTAQAGDNVGLLLRGIGRDQVASGDVITG